MASLTDMIDLKSFPKVGVRVPNSLRKRVKQIILDMDGEGVGMDGEELTMESVFAVATLHLLGMKREDQVAAFRFWSPELLGLFVAESPDLKPEADVIPPDINLGDSKRDQETG